MFDLLILLKVLTGLWCLTFASFGWMMFWDIKIETWEKVHPYMIVLGYISMAVALFMAILKPEIFLAVIAAGVIAKLVNQVHERPVLIYLCIGVLGFIYNVILMIGGWFV